jgi:hypothetical protein
LIKYVKNYRDLVGRLIIDIGYIFEQITFCRDKGGTDYSYLDMTFISEIGSRYFSKLNFNIKFAIMTLQNIPKIHMEILANK